MKVYFQSLRYTLVFSCTLCVTTACSVIVQAPQADPCTRLPQVLSLVGEYLGEEPQKLPTCVHYDPQTFENVVVELLERDGTHEELLQEEAVFKHIGLIPQKYDYARCLKSAYLREAAAFYSPYLKQVILPNWSPVHNLTLVHESVHYFQDQQLSLSEKKELRGFFRDSALATGAVLEGDARRITHSFLQKYPDIQNGEDGTFYQKLGLEDKSCTLPDSLLRLFHFQYEKGLSFWKHLATRPVDFSRREILNNIPTDTRMVLHPELYSSKNVSSSDMERSCVMKKASYAESLGEAILKTMFLQHLDGRTARRAAKGVLEDCFTSDELQWSWVSKWESQQDIEEFLSAVLLIQQVQPDVFPGKFSTRGRILTYRAQKS